MLTGGGLLDCRSLAEEVPMNKELMCDENFIRCSTMIAELLMKYKNKEYEESEESKADSSPYWCIYATKNPRFYRWKKKGGAK